MAFCYKCGTQINDDASFCHSCGTPTVKNTSAQPYFVQQPVAYGYVKPLVPGRGLGIAGMVLGIIGLFYSFIMLMASISYAEESFSRTYNYYNYYYGNYYQSSSETAAIIIVIIMFSVFSVLALSLAGSGRHKGYKTGVSGAGVVTGTIGLLMSLFSVIIVACV